MSGGNCPETPRQKMIGMMYLMLTAMLALNVSGDLINAFTLVDQSIRNQKTSTEDKLGLSFYNFESKKDQNPTRVKPKYDLAMDVKAKSDTVVNLIQEFKKLIIVTADGQINDQESPEDGLLNKSDQDKAAQVMMVEKGGARAKELKKALEDYRDAMVAACQPDSGLPLDTMLVNAINAMINTADGRNSESGESVTWESQLFEHLPIAATLGLLSAIQSNVRNVETDVVNYLYKSIDAASFKFNVLVPLVIPESQYVIQGGTYKADIMLAAYDDTMEPIVSVGGQTLPTEGGRGKYTASASSVGMKSYEAKLQIPDPVTGALKDYTVKGEYEVGAPSLVVSATKMNAMYRGLQNPIEVSVAGVSPSDLTISCAGGTMSGAGTSRTVKPGSSKEVTISVSSHADGRSQNFGSKSFRVFDVPDPVIRLSSGKSGQFKMNKKDILAGKVVAALDNFLFDVSFEVRSFDVSCVRNGSLRIATCKGTNGALNSDAKTIINSVSKGGKLFIDAVKAVGPDGRERTLNGITLTVN